jgi:hypothetical protein
LLTVPPPRRHTFISLAAALRIDAALSASRLRYAVGAKRDAYLPMMRGSIIMTSRRAGGD